MPTENEELPPVPLSGADRIQVERRRQVSEEGYDAAHDQDHEFELVDAARSYLEAVHLALDGKSMPSRWVPTMWPWAARHWKPSEDDPVRDLVKAGALIAAAIDALQAADHG